MNFLKRLTGHFHTITKHRHKVIVNCAKAGILWQGLRHDLSKYSPTEFVPGVKYYTGNKSPNEGERFDLGYSKAWLHHKGRNKHHFEYWVDYNFRTRKNEAVEMPYRYIAEMFCDRVAASKVYNGKNYKDTFPLEYFQRGMARSLMHQKSGDELETLLKMLGEKGEKETFHYLKKELKRRKHN